MGRQPMITLVSGAPGIGKSVQTQQDIDLYVTSDAKLGRAARKALIFDTNDEYGQYQSVKYNVRDPHDNGIYLRQLNNPVVRRIRPFWPDQFGYAQPMTFKDKEKTLIDLTTNYRNGLLLLEDINTYLIGFKSADTISLLCAIRHKGVDLIIQVQSISAIDPRMFQNSTWLRMHYQTDDIRRYKDRLGENFEPLKIAQNILNREYYQNNIRFFLYFNLRSKKIRGVTAEQYLYGFEMYKKEFKPGFMLTENPYMYFDSEQ